MPNEKDTISFEGYTLTKEVGVDEWRGFNLWTLMGGSLSKPYGAFLEDDCEMGEDDMRYLIHYALQADKKYA